MERPWFIALYAILVLALSTCSIEERGRRYDLCMESVGDPDWCSWQAGPEPR